MTVQLTDLEQPGAAPLALYAPTLPNWTTPVEGYDGGIGLRAIEGGLRFVIDPWTQMSVNDVVRLYWGNDIAPVWTKTIEAGEENERVSGSIDPGYIVRGDVYPLFYSVTRISQVSENSTPRLRLLVKLDRPGGFDDDLATPGHSNLRYSIPQSIIDNGVGPDEAAAGVPITILPYPFMRKNDRVRCTWGSAEKSVQVQQQHVDDPGNNPLVVLIDRAILELAGDSNGVAVAYQVIDEVGNYPDERSPWSAITYILVDLKQNRLEAPIVLEADPVSNVIDLDDLGEEDVTVLVNTVGGAFKVGDTLAMTWTGTPAEGSPVVHGPIELPVVRVGIAVLFSVPNAKLKAIAKGRASVSYLLKSPSVADRPSKNTSVSIEGDVSRLQPPRVLQAAGGQLPADTTLATVSVPYYEGRRRGDLITVHWEGTRPGGGNTYYSIRIIVAGGLEGMPIERNVPASEIAQLDGGSVKIHYVVANDDVTLSSVRESLPLNLTVGAAQPDLMQPDVIEADSHNVLLPENTPGGANVIAPFTGTLAGDTVGLRWVGSASGAHPSYEVPLSTHTAGYPVPFLVEPRYITPNLNGEVQVSYYVMRTGQPTRNSRVRTLSIGTEQQKWAAPNVIEAPAGKLDPNAHQNGFTVRVATGELREGDGIDLIIEGRPGEGSVRPERRYVTTQAYLDFPIPAPITGANLGRNVNIHFEVVRGGPPLPSQVLVLQVGKLLQQNMPRPVLEGFDGEFLSIGGIKDTTKVLCGKWPFQLYGAPVWLNYIETRSDGSSRTQNQLVGAPNDRTEGLETTADVQWLRQCKANSKIDIVLIVGLFLSATLTDATACPLRSYSAQVGLDDISTFTDYAWNGWRPWDATQPAKAYIAFSEGEYYVDTRTGNGAMNVSKYFSEMQTGGRYELSFMYIAAPKTIFTLVVHQSVLIKAASLNATSWTNFTTIITAPSKDFDIALMFSGTGGKSIDNVRLRHLPNS